jgi:hypothetical protein
MVKDKVVNLDDWAFVIFAILQAICYVSLIKAYSGFQGLCSDFLFIGHFAPPVGKKIVVDPLYHIEGLFY